MPDRELPTALPFERSLLGSILLWPKVLDACETLTPGDFYDPRHRRVYEAIRAAEAAKEPIAHLAILDRLDANGEKHGALLADLVSAADLGPKMATHAIAVIREKAVCRKILETCDAIASEAYQGMGARELLELAQSRVFALSVETTARKRTSMPALLKASVTAYDQRATARAEGRATGIPSGFTDLDGLIGGFQPGHQVVIAARPGMGKSAFMLDLLKSAARNGNNALAFSLEMPELELADRLVCGEARIDSHAYRAGSLTHGDLHSVTSALSRLKGLVNFEVDDTPQLRISDIRARVRRWRSETGTDKPGAIAVDYLQLVAPEQSGKHAGNREREVAEISRGLKAIAKESGCVVFALAQVGRECEKRDDKRPRLSDLRESGAIEADADVVAFLFREDYYDPRKDPGVADVIIAKHRGGRDGSVRLKFDAPSTTFANLAPQRSW